MPKVSRRSALLVAGTVAALAVTGSVLAASPSASPDASGSLSPSVEPSMPAASASPIASPSPSAAAAASPSTPPGLVKSPNDENGPETTTTVRGVVAKGVDGDGRPAFTLQSGGTTWTLSAGPSWFWGDKNPLAAFVGKTVSVAGSHRPGGSELDIDTVDGKPVRDPGKPPWAGGPWVVGPTHPGWKDWMANGKPGGGHGRDDAPGQVKRASPAP